MRFILAVLLMVLLGFIAGLYLPWWSIAVVAFLVALLLPQSTNANFLAGFTGIFLLWALIAIWIDVKNDSILSQKIAQLFSLGSSSVLLIIVTALTGGLVGGFAAMSGGAVRGKSHK